MEKPLYLQIKNYILGKIESGEWGVHDQISSEAELAALFKASRMTVNRAVNELAAEHRLLRKQGSGTYVAPDKSTGNFLDISSIAEEIQEQGGTHSCDIIHLDSENIAPHLAEQMNLAPYSEVFHSILVHKVDGIPLQLAMRYINPVLADDFLQQDFTKTTPAQYLLAKMPIYSAEHLVEAIIPDKWIRDLLAINSAEPCLVLTRKTAIENVVATLSYFYYPGSRYNFGGRFNKAGVAHAARLQKKMEE